MFFNHTRNLGIGVLATVILAVAILFSGMELELETVVAMLLFAVGSQYLLDVIQLIAIRTLPRPHYPASPWPKERPTGETMDDDLAGGRRYTPDQARAEIAMRAFTTGRIVSGQLHEDGTLDVQVHGDD